MTSDFEVLATVSGMPLDFVKIPKQTSLPTVASNFNSEQREFLRQEINKLESKGIIQKCDHEPGEFISPIFLTPKSDGSYRLILNLKKLNEHMPYVHFKMQTIEAVLNLVTKNCFMAKIDLKDAYYSIKIGSEFQKYLKFRYDNVLYQFTCLPNGLSSGPRKFTKILKPPISHCQRNGAVVSGYIDDLITLANTFTKCFNNINLIIDTFSKLGFVIHPEKSLFVPSQCITYLGFIIDSKTMTVSLTNERKENINALGRKLLAASSRVKVREVAQLLGMMSASFIAVKFGKLNYRALERDKISALKSNHGNYEGYMEISSLGKADIWWWVQNVFSSFNDICVPNPALTLTTDASTIGWGAVLPSCSTGGLFNEIEKQEHINVLELKAILFGLKSLCKHKSNTHIKILTDNTTALHCINNMGSCRSLACDNASRDIWHWAIDKNIHVSASHIPGILNEEADAESRKTEHLLEWKLKCNLFEFIVSALKFLPNIDLFASRINAQLKPFVSYRPDPEALHVNAFSICWKGYKFYAFPPFSCVGKVVQKVIHDNATGILVVPDWPNQPWYNLLMEITVHSILIPSSADQLFLPSNPTVRHPLKHLQLMACLVHPCLE